MTGDKNRYLGCLLGGAVGDALGAPVEFLDWPEIARQFGDKGITDFAPAYGRVGAITDDTQMTLFTAEGLIRAWMRRQSNGICHIPSVVHHAYLRWLITQGETPNTIDDIGRDGWLIGCKSLWSRRAPGNTCLEALKATTAFGTPARNSSKGCGTVMRIAPVAMVLPDEQQFDTAQEISALTHGHPTAGLSAGFLAVLIASCLKGAPLPQGIYQAKTELANRPDHDEVMNIVERAERLARSKPGSRTALEELGGAWVAEEALAISLYCALSAKSFEEAVILAVNHSGDSDSTGAITGNIMGALVGVAGIPERWIEGLELRNEIAEMAGDLIAVREERLDPENPDHWARYPGW